MSRKSDAGPAGIINLYKPVGHSSAQYVYRLRHILGIRRIGHAGSLDPFADGVLLACVGKATRLFDRLTGLPKHYRTTIHLGVTNETFDTERAFEPVPGAQPPPREAVEEAVAGMVGEIDQVPPAFSAVRVSGESSYHLARRGEAVPHQPKRIRIYRMKVIEYAWPLLRLDLQCSRGTYIRAIARDLGAALGCGGCCETLSRLAVGPFRIEQAVNLETTLHPEVAARLIPLDEVLRLLEA